MDKRWRRHAANGSGPELRDRAPSDLSRPSAKERVMRRMW